MKFRAQFLLVAFVSPFVLAISAHSQATPQANGGIEQHGFTWRATYEGSGDSDGFITDINSTVGYDFGKHFAMDMGVPYLFIAPSTSKTGTTSSTGIGNPYLGLRYSAKGSAVDFSTSLNSAIPTASTAKGLSTGHVTVDWTNHFANEFDLFTPFFDLGLGNAVPDTRFLHRAYLSYGDVAHLKEARRSIWGTNSASVLPATTYFLGVRSKSSSAAARVRQDPLKAARASRETTGSTSGLTTT